MANQAQRDERSQDERSQDEPQRADPRQAQYVINITPEQYESQLRQGQVKTEVAPRVQIPMGGSGTATVSFQDSAGEDVQIKQVAWSATGPVTVVGDETNPTSAKITPVGLGPAHVTATGQSDKGSAEAHVEVMVIEPAGAPVGGTIEITAEPGSGEGEEGATFSYQGQTLPVPPPAPPKDAALRTPPAQVLAQPSPQPQPQEESEEPPPTEEIPPAARRD